MSRTFVIAALVFCLSSESLARSTSLGEAIEDAVHRYSNIAVVSVTYGEVIEVGHPMPCGFLYKGVVEDEVKGRINRSEVSFVSRRGFSVGDKYLLFLSETRFADTFVGTVKGDEGRRERYYGHGKDWFDACVARLEQESSAIYTAWPGTRLEFTDVSFETTKKWLHFLPGQLLSIRGRVEVQPEKVSVCIDADDDCWLSSYREVVSEESIIRWMIGFLKPEPYDG